MNKNQYWLILATTTYNVQPKYVLDSKLKAFGVKAPEYNLDSVVSDAVSDDADAKAAALEKLNDSSAFWYMKNDVVAYKRLHAKLKKLRATDFLKIHGALNAVADVTFVYDDNGAEFHINWVLNRKEAEKLNEEEGEGSEGSGSTSGGSDVKPEPVPETKFTVSVNNSATEIVTSVEPSSAEVVEGQNFTATLTFAEGKSADDISVDNGSVEGTTLTVASVTSETTVTISAKE
jgi:hypothetical protein